MMMRTSISKSAFTSHVMKYFGKDCQKLFLQVTPTPASRPRVSKWGTYYGKNYEKFRREVRDFLADEYKKNGEQLTGPLSVYLEFLVPPPKTTKRDYPRGDVDNYAKGPLDSITSHTDIWKDDDQIINLAVSKRFCAANEEPGIQILYKEEKA
jgi:Holliday junction resolvase RusA-like endonuclease